MRIAEKLQSDIDDYKEIKMLSQSQLEAAAVYFGKITEKDTKKAFWKGALLNFTFFIFGALMTLYSSDIVEFLR